LNKAWIETRKKQLKEKMNDPDYLVSSYDKQRIVQNKLKENDVRKRVN